MAVYSAGQGNGILGLGWRLPVASVARKTETGIPRYDDRDPLTLSSTDDLLPLLVPSATGWQTPPYRVAGDWRITRYRLRTEGPFARIERWERAPEDVHWRCLTKDGATQVFGRTPAARVFDDARPEAIFEWLLEEWFDAKGNRIRYEYARDDEASAPPGPERNRRHVQRYLRRILYGNSRVDAGPERIDLDDAALSRRYLFEVLIDYGDLDDDPVALVPTAPGEETTAGWPARPDPFSSYRAGFELRTLRRCERILIFHHFPELGAPRMVRSVRFSHQVEGATGMSMLRSIAVTEHRTTPAGRRSAPAPPIEFAYTQFDPRSQRLRTMTAPTGVPPTGALDDPAVQFVDLDGRGMPDLLDTTGGEYMVWRNRGAGVLDPPRRLLPAPGPVSLADPGVRLGDLAGDGRPDVIVLNGGEGGFFERAETGWARYRRIPSLPGLSLADRNARLVDLTGNGLSDILVTTPGHLVWYECLGEDGYAAPRALPRIHDLERFPDVMFDDPEDRVRLADMTGDGLSDIVVVRGRRVDYWPNLGRGRFGARVTIAGAPDLPQPLDPRRLFLVDLDGSGCADLIYVDAGWVRYWHNRSGNGWSEGREIAGTPDASRSGAVCTDILGAGTMAIVWGRKAGRAADGLRFLDLCGGRKPYLLSEMTNGRGARTRVEYGSSTQHRLADEARGSPWTTLLPFPIQVINRLEVIDEISGSSLMTSYRYHDGCYAGRDREFRGFARVDQIDAESFTPVARSAAAGGQPLQVVPPVETRTWFHLGLPAAEAGDGHRGAYLGDPAGIRLGGDELPDGDAREALRALRGSVLRTEVFGLDDTPQAVHPYLVTERRHLVRRLQPASPGHPAVHHVIPVDELRHEYERDPSSPRTSHHLVLAVNEYGDATEQATITYPRRGPTDDPQQAQLTALYTRDDIIALDEAELYLAGVLTQARSYEVGGLQWDPASRRALQAAHLAQVRVDPDDFLGPTQPFDARAGAVQKRIHSWRRSFYRDPATADQVDPGTRAHRLALGTVGTVPLPYECCEAAFDDSLLQQVFGAATGLPVGASDLEAAGHHREPDVANWWWISSGQHAYDPGGFFTVTRRRDPFGNVAATTYDRYDLLPTRVEDPAENVVQAEQDYRVLKPRRVTDQNGNVTEVAYDGHGLVVGVALLGKDGEADTLDGFEIEPDAGLLADPIGNADQLLAGATTRHIPDIWRYHRHGTPNAIHTLTRRRHAASGAPALPVHAVTYADGFGREIQSKVEAEQEPGGGRRWVTTGWRVLNNKGKPVREFEPFFTSSADYEPDVRRGTSAVIVYDPLERQVATLLPNRTFQKQAITPWRRTQWDANDTVAIADPRSDADIGGLIARLSDLGPSWYERRAGGQLGEAERDAAEKALAHAGTPEVGHLDGQGRTVRTVRGDSASGVQQTRFRHNLRGDLIEVIDVLDRRALIQDFDLIGRRLRLRSQDAGEHWTVPDAAGRPVATLDARGVLTRLTYDALRRPLHVTVRDSPGATERTVLQTVYGESAPDAAARNLRGRILEHRDQAGIARSDRYDFKGNLLRASRQLIVAGQPPDWSANPAVSDEVFTSAWTYDALNRPLTRTLPDGTELQVDYDARGQLGAIRVGRTGTTAADPILTSLVYDAHGRRTTCELANGAVTTYTYDPDVHRLTGARTLRGADLIQDLTYTFDPVGNVTTLRDDGQPTLFFNNGVVTPDAGFTYDSLYRLVRATGREHLGLTQAGSLAAAQPSSPSDAPRVGLAHPHDSRAVARYVQSYVYDAADNLKSVSHHAAGTGYVTRYDYRPPGNEPASNRLRATSVPGDPDAGPFSARYGYDPAGNMTAMPHLDVLEWDHRSQLRSVRRGTMQAHYDRDAAGQRVRKTVEKGAGLVEETIYLGDLEIFRRRVGGELRLERHTVRVSDDSDLIALVERVVHDQSGPVTDPAPVVRHQLVDHLGSSHVELDADGAVISREEHYPLGGTALSTAKSAPGLSLKRYRYTGKEHDEESGFYDVGARAYAPWLGRWTACDPAGVQDGMNLYLYARGNPIRFKDPTGRQTAESSPPPPAAERLPSAVSLVGRPWAVSLLGMPSWATEPAAQANQPQSIRLLNAYIEGLAESWGALASGIGTAFKWFFWDNFGGLFYDITKADVLKQRKIDAQKGVRAIKEFLLAGPDAAVANMGRGLVSGLDRMNAALRRGDFEEAMRGLGNFMGAIGPMLVGVKGPPSPTAVNPALVTAEGVLIDSGMATVTGGPNLLPAGVAMMANAKAKTDGATPQLPNGAPNKAHWNLQEQLSLKWARKAFPGLRWYGQVELYRLAGDKVTRLGRILDAMAEDILTGKLELHEWSTERNILEGRAKYSQLEYQLNVFNEARASGGSISIWGHPQGTNLLLDVTYAEQYIGTYLHWPR